jgi:hypothetical protein
MLGIRPDDTDQALIQWSAVDIRGQRPVRSKFLLNGALIA